MKKGPKNSYMRLKKLRESRPLNLNLSKHPTVLSEWETLFHLLDGYSLSRYGDGEIKHMSGKRNVSQVFHSSLQQALWEVFRTPLSKHLVGIPNVYSGRVFTEVDDGYIDSMRRRFAKVADRNRVYASSYVSRGDLCPLLSWSSFWSLWGEVWKGRDVVLVRGHEGRANMNMMVQARTIEHVETPSAGAWKDYDRILKECLSHPKTSLFLLCVGPTATVLAWDLCKRGRRAVDIGHLGLFYRRSWGVECMEDRQVWNHRPTDPGYIKGVTDI